MTCAPTWSGDDATVCVPEGTHRHRGRPRWRGAAVDRDGASPHRGTLAGHPPGSAAMP